MQTIRNLWRAITNMLCFTLSKRCQNAPTISPLPDYDAERKMPWRLAVRWQKAAI
jgi:hypothetical protein